MKIQELKSLVLKTKKVNKDESQALANILKQVEMKTVGVKWNPADEEKIVLQSIKKELKEQIQSQESGAPFSQTTIDVCRQMVVDQSPQQMPEDELNNVIFAALVKNPKLTLGQIMGTLKKAHGDAVDMTMASRLAKKMLEDSKF